MQPVDRMAIRTPDQRIRSRVAARRPSAALAAAVIVLAACNAAADPRPSPDQSASEAEPVDTALAVDTAVAVDTAPDAADSGAADTGTTQPWTAAETRVDRGFSGAAVLRSVRTARHEDFDRITLDFGSDAVPGYRIGYVDRPVRQCGSGHTVEVAGDGWLSIEVLPAHAHTEEGQATVEDRDRMLQLPNVRQIVLTCDFEGHVEWVAGVRSPTPYRVLELSSPGRLVVDVRHAGGS